MTDPRDTPNYKAKRVEEKTLLLLGAILDALKALQPVQAPPAPAPAASSRRTKAD